MSARNARIEIHEGPDQNGHYLYTLYWTADYHPGHPDGEHRTAERGQVFRSNPYQPEVPNDRIRDCRGDRRPTMIDQQAEENWALSVERGCAALEAMGVRPDSEDADLHHLFCALADRYLRAYPNASTLEVEKYMTGAIAFVVSLWRANHGKP